MNTVVVYESMFGNTEQVAQHIADAVRATDATATVVEVSRAEPGQLHGADLLVVGAPTHAFSLSRPNTREDAVRQGADPARTMLGVREWLATLETAFPAAADRPRVAVFDTRAEKVRRLPGSAAKRAAKVLRARGFQVVDRPTSFYVEDVKGPLAAEEIERAQEWAARLTGLAGTSEDCSAP